MELQGPIFRSHYFSVLMINSLSSSSVNQGVMCLIASI